MPHVVITDEQEKASGQPYLVPFSIAHALLHERESKPQEAPIDIVAVLLSIDIDLHANKATMLIGDPSIPLNTCAKIFLSGSSSISWVVSCQIKMGDLIRFNRLELKKGIDSDNFSVLLEEEKKRTKAYKQQLPKVICEFYPSWKNPEAGAVMKKIGGANTNCEQYMNDMSLPTEWVSSLYNWFQQIFLSSSFSSSMVSSTVPISNRKKRKLATITNPHLLCDVRVQILALHNEPNNFSGSKYTRNNKSSKSQTLSTVAFVSDGFGEENSMGLYRCERFYTILLQALESKSYVSITNLLSSPPPFKFSSNLNVHDMSMVLIPTAETNITVVEHTINDQNQNENLVGMSQSAKIREEFTSGENGSSSLNCLEKISTKGAVAKQNIMRDQKQFNPDTKAFSSKQIIIQAKVVDIYWDEVGISITQLNSPLQLLKTLIGTTDCGNIIKTNRVNYENERNEVKCKEVTSNYVYRPTTITLLYPLQNATPSSSPTYLKVKADQRIMKILCISVPVNEIENAKKESGTIRDKKNGEGLGNFIFELFHGMIEEKIVFEWTICPTCYVDTYGRKTCGEILNVKLPVIHII